MLRRELAWSATCWLLLRNSVSMLFQHILFPVDFSPQCEQIVPAVRDLMTRFQARVTLLHSLEIRGAGGLDPSLGEGLLYFDNLLQEQQKSLAAFRAAHFSSSSSQVDSVLEKDSPARAIAAYAECHLVDLIMMPTHGYGPFRAALLGSVTAKVIHDTSCPVWTSVHTEKIHNPLYPYRLLVCAVDDLPTSVSVIRRAGELAKAFESSLALVHAVAESGKRTESEIRSNLEQLGMAGEVSVPIYIQTGEIVRVVTDAAARQGADLVILGRGRSSQTLGSLRSHVYEIIRKSPCPVLTI